MYNYFCPDALEPIIRLTDEQFHQLCQANRDVRFERTADGKLIIMPPTGWGTGNRNSELTFQLQAWSRQNQLGKAFDSSTGFTLPNGADRSPDAAWVKLARLEALNPDPDRFLPLAPDFIVEFCSASDNLRSRFETCPDLQQKMQEYIDNGVRLGWLINPKDQQVEIYQPDQAVETRQAPITLSGEDVLPGFVLNLNGIL